MAPLTVKRGWNDIATTLGRGLGLEVGRLWVNQAYDIEFSDSSPCTPPAHTTYIYLLNKAFLNHPLYFNVLPLAPFTAI